MTSNYLAELDTFCHKFLLQGHYQPTREDVMLFQQRYEAHQAVIFESLLLHDVTNFKVTGENMPLVVLLSQIGVKGVEKLIDQEGIAFTHWATNIMSFVTPIKGVIPVLYGETNSTVHTDPEESIAEGLKALTNALNKNDKKIIIRKARDLYTYPPKGIGADSVEMAKSAFTSNKLFSLGLDANTSELTDLPPAQVAILAKCAQEILEYKYLAHAKFTSSSSQNTHKLFLDSTQKTNHPSITETFSIISKLECFPNLLELYANIEKPLTKSIHFRKTTNARKFRKWINETTTKSDAQEIAKAYIDAIANKRGFVETKMGKFTKTVFMASAGAAAGSIAGPIGTGIGGIVGSLLAPATDVAIDLVDEFYLGKLLSGWSPRMIFDDLKKLGIRVEPTLDESA